MRTACLAPLLAAGLVPLAGCQNWFGRGSTAEAPPRERTAGTPAADPTSPPMALSKQSDPPPAGSVLPGVLVVNNETITVDDVLEPIRPRLEQAARTLPRDDYYDLLFQTIRRQLVGEVSERLIWQEASRELKSDEQKKRVDQAIDQLERERITAEFGGRESRYEKYLESVGRTREQVRERLKRQIVCEQYLRDRLAPRIGVRKRDLQKYYEEHRADFTEARTVELWMIEVPVRGFFKGFGPPTDAEKQAARDAARAHALAALSKIRAGQPFEEVARADCMGLHKDDGGNWGVISSPLRGPYEQPSKVALGLASGQVSDVIDTPMAFFIVRAGQVTGGTTRRFEEVQSEIAVRLQTEQFNQLRTEFMQRTLDRASVGNLEPFVKAVVARAPESRYTRSAATESSMAN